MIQIVGEFHASLEERDCNKVLYVNVRPSVLFKEC